MPNDILTKCETVSVNYSAIRRQTIYISLNLCNDCDQTLFFSMLSPLFARSLRGC